MNATPQMLQATLNNITDWYLPIGNPLGGMYYPGPMFIKTNEMLHEHVNNIYKASESQQRDDFIVNVDKCIYRGHKMTAITGDQLVFRRIPNEILSMGELGIDEQLQKIFVHEKLNNGGLILVAGETGNGKSTTCASIIKSRLEKFNSFCLTVEDPPEFPLGGVHKKGLCYQTSVSNSGFADALKGAVRCYPVSSNSILFVGEIRDAETAAEVLRIASNGHLVFSTIHSTDIVGSIRRFVSLCSGDKNLNESEIKSSLSSCLRLVIHQKLVRNVSNVKKLHASILFSPNGSSIIANRIRTSTIEALGTEIHQQQNLIIRKEVDKLLEMWDTVKEDKK